MFTIITSDDIKFIESIEKVLKLNNIKTIVCNINPSSASILFHFIDEVKFRTELNIQSAIDAIKNK